MLPLILGAAGVGGLLYLATRKTEAPKSTTPNTLPTPVTTTPGTKPVPVVTAPPPTSSPTSLPVPIIPDPFIPIPSPSPSVPISVPGITTPGFQNQAAVVATEKDPLNVRSGPTTAAGVIGQVVKGSAVTVTSPKIAGTGSTTGWVSIIQGNIKGFVSNDFLMYPGLVQTLPTIAQQLPSNLPLPPAPPPDIISIMTQSTPIVAAAIPVSRQALVTTATDPLNVRSLPSSSGSIMGKVAKGSKVTVTNGGTPIAGAGSTKGWLPITQGNVMGFASADFLTLI